MDEKYERVILLNIKRVWSFSCFTWGWPCQRFRQRWSSSWPLCPRPPHPSSIVKINNEDQQQLDGEQDQQFRDDNCKWTDDENRTIELTPDGAPFFSFSPFFSTSTLLTVLLAVLTSESTLLASESEQLEVGRRNNGTKWRDKRMWNYSQLAIKRCRQQSPAVHISCPAQKSSQGGLGRFKC